jgi:hypothetical protein
MLAHEYRAVDDDVVLEIVYSGPIVFKAEVRELLSDSYDSN